jgi:uncharacterized repeat protein (TIGR04138 family)
MKDPLREIAARDARYSVQAFQFLYDGLEFAVRLHGKEQAEGAERHVSAQELLEGLRQYALRLFGPLAAQVWRSWGVRETMDWGRIVFLLVDHQMLNRRPEDRIEDFEPGFDFDQAFAEGHRVELPPEVLTPRLGE